MTLDELAEEIANLMSTARCGCAVYMDGKHLPTPRERREAQDLAQAFGRYHPELEFK